MTHLRDPLVVSTVPVTVPLWSALDPLVEEVSWVAWEMRAASPLVATGTGLGAITAAFDRIVETSWVPGRLVVISELRSDHVGDAQILRCFLAIGAFGPTGTTATEASAATGLVESSIVGSGLPYLIKPVDASELLAADPVEHAALLRQRTMSIEVPGDRREVPVMARWNPVREPWSNIAQLLVHRAAPTRVRATVLATELSLTDRVALDEGIARLDEAVRRCDDRPELRYTIDRARATLVDLRSSFASPLLCVELAVTSDEPLPELFLRGLGCSFTSELDVLRREGYTAVAAQPLLLGGFDVERPGSRLCDALRAGLPLRGGVEERQLSDLCSLTESPIGWPVPFATGLPTIPTRVTADLPVPKGFDHGVLVGVGTGDRPIRLPSPCLSRHALVVGTTGCGKTTVLTTIIRDTIERGHGFLVVDTHGGLADRAAVDAEEAGLEPIVFDPLDGATARWAPARRYESPADDESVTLAARRFSDAVVAIWPSDWAGPRFREKNSAIVGLMAALGVELCEALEIARDPDSAQGVLKRETLPVWVRRSLQPIHGSGNYHDGAAVIDWVVSKTSGIANGPARRLLAEPGQGVDLPAAVRAGRPVVVSLAGLADADARLFAHLVMTQVLEAAMGRGIVEESVPPYPVVVDEAHRYPPNELERIIAEGRKFAVPAVLATQSLGQLPSGLADAAVGAAIRVAFRQTIDSAAQLAGVMHVDPPRLVDQPDFHAYIAVGDSPTFTLRTLPLEPRQARARAELAPLPAVGSAGRGLQTTQPR